MRTRLRRLKPALFLGAALVPGATLAQTTTGQVAPPPPAAGARPPSGQPAGAVTPVSPSPASGELGEVVVTAQRRSENLEKTPVAVSVVSAEQLKKENITTETDLPKVAPGLIVRTGATSNEVNYSLRGQSLDAYSGATPGVLPYINEVQISTNSGSGSGATAFYDLQSVQVLKGPQGTLFGRDATGGAVLFTTAKPTNVFGGYVSALGGDYSTRQFEGALNVPIVDDKVLARVSAFYGAQDGFQRNLFDGSRPGTGEREGVRASLTVKPTSRITDEFVFDYYNVNQASETSVLYNLQNIPGATPVAFLYSLAPQNPYQALFKGYLATHTNPTVISGGPAAFLPIQQARGPFTVSINDATKFNGTNGVATNALTFDIDDNTKFRNIFGYGSLRSHTQGDSDGTPFGIAGDSYRDGPGHHPEYGAQANTTIVSDESQIVGTTMNQNLKYTVGFYYSEVTAYVRLQSQFFDLFGGVPSINEGFKDNTTYGVYGQGTYDLSSLTGLQGLSATAGLRYNNEKARFDTLPGSQFYPLQAASPPGTYSNQQSKDFDNVGWTFGAQEQLNPSLLFYVVTRRSYKDGGFNSSLAPLNGYSDVGGDFYKTEKIDDVEGGAKFQGRLFDFPTRVNVAIYNNWVDNSQRAAFALSNGSPAAITVNVPKQEDTGVELDGQVKPLSWLTLGGAFNYTDARFTNQRIVAFGGVQNFATVPDTPEYSGTAFVEAEAPINDRFTVTGRAELYAQTYTYFSSSANINPGARLPGYETVNLLASLEDNKSGWSLIANVKNVGNKTYYVGGIPLAQLLDYNTALPGAPRTFTIQARYKF